MLAICCLCATLSRQEYLVLIHDENHPCIIQLMHAFKLKIEVKQFVCNECIKMLKLCDDFLKKIERAQDSLKILFKAKTKESSAEKSSNIIPGTIRARDFCRIQISENENIENEPSSFERERENEDPIEETTRSNSNFINPTDIKEELNENETIEVHEVTTNRDTNIGETEVMDENVETSDGSQFMGFEQDAAPERSKKIPGKIKISMIKFQCAKCSLDFPSEEVLQKHLQDHSKSLASKCKQCNKIFRHPSALRIHMRSHNNETKYQCKTCSKYFRHASSLWSHTKLHTEGRFKCHLCSKSFFQPENLKSHIDEHKYNRSFSCEMCNESFYSQRKLTKHVDDHHVASVWKCKECPSTFSTLAALNSHMQRFNHSQYTCHICYRNFRSEIWYQSHLRTHSIERIAQENASTTPIVLEPL